MGSTVLMVLLSPLQVWRKGESHPDREGHLHREGGEELTWLPHRKVGECLDPAAKAVPHSPGLGYVAEPDTFTVQPWSWHLVLG